MGPIPKLNLHHALALSSTAANMNHGALEYLQAPVRLGPRFILMGESSELKCVT